MGSTIGVFHGVIDFMTVSNCSSNVAINMTVQNTGVISGLIGAVLQYSNVSILNTTVYGSLTTSLASF